MRQLLGSIVIVIALSPSPISRTVIGQDNTRQTQSATPSLRYLLPDADGRQHSERELGRSKAAVFFFIATECPISNRYAPEVNRIVTDYDSKGIAFFAVQSDPDLQAAGAREHSQQFGYKFHVLLDPEQKLASNFGVVLTPTAVVSEKRFMPPWKADRSDYEFKSDRRLNNEQIGIIKQWAEEGAAEGNLKDLPALPKFTEGWQLDKPDLIVKMSEAFSVPADGRDIYRNFALPLNLNEDKWVKAVEFRPEARSVVHHSLFFFDTTGSARKQDEKDPLPGYNGGMGGLGLGAFSGGNLRSGAGNQATTVGSLGG